MADFGISFFPVKGVLFTAWYAGLVIFDFQIINQNYWLYDQHLHWVKSAWGAKHD